MNPIPTVSKNSPLKIESVSEEYKESPTEKRGKILFWAGVGFFVLVVTSSFFVYILWI